MIVCQECGNSAPSADGFCSSCGVLLEWSGQPVETPPPPPPLAGPLMPPMPPAPELAAGPGSALGTPPPPPTSAPPWLAAPAMAAAAPAPPGPAPVGAMQPDEEAVRPAPVPITPPDHHDGLFCSACGTRNADGRTFCRYCGQPLDLTVTGPMRRRWWQRLFRRRKSDPAAGDRPRGFRRREEIATRTGGTRRRLRFKFPLAKAAPILMVLSLIGVGLGPARSWITRNASELFGTAKKKVSGHYVPAVPLSAVTSTSARGHGPKLLIDGVKDTWWQSKGHPDGIGETLTIKFANPVDIGQIGLLGGPKGDKYRTEARPRTIQITTDGKPHGQVSFDDKADFQPKRVNLRNVSSITLVITAAYPGQGGGHAIAIRELQFFSFQV